MVSVDSFVCHDGAGEFAYRRLGRARLVPCISIFAAMREWLVGRFWENSQIEPLYETTRRYAALCLFEYGVLLLSCQILGYQQTR